jgi:hypothetical protein
MPLTTASQKCKKRELSTFLKSPLAVEEHILGRTWESPGDRSPYESGFYSEFAGILQVKIR